MKRLFQMTVFLILIGLALIGVGCSKTEDEEPQRGANLPVGQTSNEQDLPIALDDPRFPIRPSLMGSDAYTRGQAIYNEKCASCHGIRGEGQMPDPYAMGMAPPHDDTGHT
ncbi:MAG: hypothetical protein CUN55_02380 [Phototrophicales bacterium]|nr:MAG: hypothetical protein CUN55_02380 [Phototrophicales bacterium]